jgi:predicted PurR-regulated permease PerM
VAAALVARELVTVLLVVVLALVLSLPLSAAAGMAQRRGLPRAVGAIAALTAAGGAVTAIGFLLLPRFTTEARQLVGRLPAIFEGVRHSIHALTGGQAQQLSLHVSSFLTRYIDHPARLLGPAAQIGLSLLGVIVVVVAVIVAAFLIALRPDALLEGSMRLVPGVRRAQARDVYARVRVAWLGWLTAIAIDMVVLGGLLFAGMKIVGLPFAFGFAVFSALLTVIPNYGSIVSAIPPILVGLSQSFGEAVLVSVVYVIVNQIEGNLILPLIMAQRVELHPAVVAIGVLMMASLFGVIGVVIAVPLLSAGIILIQVLWVEPQERSAAGAITAK